jgi:hypothetical protein
MAGGVFLHCLTFTFRRKHIMITFATRGTFVRHHSQHKASFPCQPACEEGGG